MESRDYVSLWTSAFLVLSVNGQVHMPVDTILQYREFVAVTRIKDEGLVAFTPKGAYLCKDGASWTYDCGFEATSWPDINIVENGDIALIELANEYRLLINGVERIIPKPKGIGRIEAVTMWKGELVLLDGRYLYRTAQNVPVRLDVRGRVARTRCLVGAGDVLYLGGDFGVARLELRKGRSESYGLQRIGRFKTWRRVGAVDDLHVGNDGFFAAARGVWSLKGGRWVQLRLLPCLTDMVVPRFVLRIQDQLWIASSDRVLVYDLTKEEPQLLEHFKDRNGARLPKGEVDITGMTYDEHLDQVHIRTLAHGIYRVRRADMRPLPDCRMARVVVDLSESIGRMPKAKRTDYLALLVDSVESLRRRSPRVVVKRSHVDQMTMGAVDSTWLVNAGFAKSINLKNNLDRVMHLKEGAFLCAAQDNPIMCFRDAAGKTHEFSQEDIDEIIGQVQVCRGYLSMYFITDRPGRRSGWKESRSYTRLCRTLRRSKCGRCRTLQIDADDDL